MQGQQSDSGDPHVLPFRQKRWKAFNIIRDNEKADHILPLSHTGASALQDEKPMRNKSIHRSSTQGNFWNLSGNSRKHTRLQVKPEEAL